MANVHVTDPGFRFVLCLNLARRGGGRGTAPARGVGEKAGRYRGGRHNNQTNMDDTFTHEQREAFVRLLQNARERRQHDFEDRMSEKIRFEILPKLVHQQGFAGNIQKMGKLAEELVESARALQTSDSPERKEDGGFWSRLLKPQDMREILARMIRPYQENEQEKIKEYDRAALKVMSADSVEDARKIVESLL